MHSSENIKKVNPKGHQFQQPTKRINFPEDLETFKKSQTYAEMLTFIFKVQQSIQGKPISATKRNPKFDKIVEFLETLKQLLIEVPPIQQAMRFGNKAFRDWLTKADPIIDQFLEGYLSDDLKPGKSEFKLYISESFGSSQRIDYGTGHEFSFFLFLFCLYKFDVFQDEDLESMARNVFYKYIEVIRKVQLQYMLEPAGSHGVWGLDDYQFLPFLFGASELIDNPYDLLPDVILREPTIQKYKSEYMFLQCVDFVLQVKTGPFHEHSPIIHSLNQVPSWTKVSQGLLKMFSGEVLNKLPVIKHTQFGSIIKFE